MSINCSPIFNNVYSRKNIDVTFSDDFKTAHISDGKTRILVESSFFTDVVKVMKRAHQEELDEEKAMSMLWNMSSTSLSEPYEKEFEELN